MKSFVHSATRFTDTLLFMFASIHAGAQSKMIKKVFMLLPPSFVYGLTNSAKDSMLKGKTYYPADNDTESVLAFNCGESVEVKDYMYISMAYETSQQASGMVELRGFEMKGKKLIIVSSTGGVEGINYQQNDLSLFVFDGQNKLNPYKTKVFPDWSEHLFLKSGVPDSIKKVIINNSNLTFDLSNKQVTLSLNSSFLLTNPAYRKRLKGDQIKYTWTGKEFIAGSVHFSDQNN